MKKKATHRGKFALQVLISIKTNKKGFWNNFEIELGTVKNKLRHGFEISNH